ncbi:MAG: ammonium transporter [Steroidobacteraceae bacterium]
MRSAQKTLRTRLTTAAIALIALIPSLAWAGPAVPDKGDTAWMLTSTALVLLMSVPALGLFYGGLVRTKNMLSVLMQVFVGFSLISVLWCIYGYSIAFTAGNAFIGGLSRLFLAGTFNAATGAFSTIGTFDKGVVLNELVYVAFQATFAAITCCLILGALVERVKFSGILLFMVFWFTFCYCPVAHMVWYWPGLDTAAGPKPVGGLLWQWGALDFAGGTVVHINAGVAGLIGARVLGKRIGLGKEPMPPHSITMMMIGASLLWFGWFGFNAGSALEANGSAALAFLNTYLATACAVLTWMSAEWIVKGKPSMLGAASGAVAGLVAITPAWPGGAQPGGAPGENHPTERRRVPGRPERNRIGSSATFIGCLLLIRRCGSSCRASEFLLRPQHVAIASIGPACRIMVFARHIWHVFSAGG